MILTILVNTISPFVMVIFPKFILDEVFGGRDISKIIFYISLMSALTIIFGLLNAVLTNKLHFLSMQIKSRLRMEMSKKVTLIDYWMLEDANILNIKQQATNFLESDVDIAIYTLPSLAASILSCIGYVFIISTFNILVVVIMLLVILLNSIIQSRIEKYAYEYRTEMAPTERKIAYFIMNVPSQKFAKDIRLYNLSQWLYEKYKAQLNTTDNAYKKVFDKRTFGSVLTTSTNVFQTILIYVWLIYGVINKGLTVGDFTMYLSAITNFSTSVTGVFSSWVKISQIRYGLDDYITFMNLPDSELVVNDNADSTNVIDTNNISIEFKDVWFKYPNKDDYAIKNLSIKINSLEKISIVGENGAGKTTFIKLLTRLYTPTQGEIFINGVDINSININEYRKLFSVVFQDFTIFAFSIKENIALADTDSKEANDKVHSAIKDIHFDNKISNLKNSIDTYIETTFDASGIQLSGGESQKLAIARAIYKDAPIVILDEPTAALDPRAEYEIYSDFSQMVEGKMSFFISHRLSSSRFCDKVIVFKKGEIIEYGSHFDLIEKNGLYSELYNMQSQFYVD